MKKSNPFWLLTAAVFLLLLLPTLVQDGMFLDGVTYSAISKNMANGLGSFWKPYYTQTQNPVFHAHPPLVFAIQSLFFSLFGSAFYTERIYSLFTALLGALAIIMCWRLVTKSTDYKQYAWLPVLLWISVPVVSWCYINNTLENTLSVFTLFSVYFICKGLMEDKTGWLIVGSLFIFLAFLCKGFVALFPMAATALYWLSVQRTKISKTLLYSAITILLPLTLFYFCILLIPEAKEYFTDYLQIQMFPALKSGEQETITKRFGIVFNLLTELLLPLLIAVFIILKNKRSSDTKKLSLFFLLIALSAALPLMVTLKQRTSYLMPSIPFFAMAISLIIIPFLKNKIEALSGSVVVGIKRLSVFLLISTLIFSIYNFKKYTRYEVKLKDIYVISKNIPSGTIISTTREFIWSDWVVVAYMARINNISLSTEANYPLFIISNTFKIDPLLLDNYSVIDLNLKHYMLLKKKAALPSSAVVTE